MNFSRKLQTSILVLAGGSTKRLVSMYLTGAILPIMDSNIQIF